MLERCPKSGFAWKVLGVALQSQGKDALAASEKAAQFLPEDAQAHYNFGVVLQEHGHHDKAVKSYSRALELKSDYAEAHCNLGVALKELGHFDRAVASYRQALEIIPNLAKAHSNLGNALRELGQLDDAVASCIRALEIEPDFYKAYSNLLFLHNYQTEQSAAVLLDEARGYGNQVARKARPYTEWLNAPESEKCLRVGLVSGDLRNHPVGFFTEGVLAALASNFSEKLEFIAYPTQSGGDKLTDRIKACCHGWRSAVGLSDEDLARRIREDSIDILIDLSGHTAHNRLPMFAWKPAPVQVSWLGYFATTGVAAMDYLIADFLTVPESEEAYFTEKVWRLPETQLCFTPPEVEIDVSPAPSLSNGYVTFGCFNNLTKINEVVVALWARVLKAVPHSRLFLKTKQLQESSVRQRILELFSSHGIDFQRLVLEGWSTRFEYLAAYQRVDISLDPFPFPGGTTSVEGLWMGVPVLTMTGQSFLSRQGVGILNNAGLPEWVAADSDDYLAKAIKHASDLSRLATLRSNLRYQLLASPLFNASSFAGHFEAALRGMWAHWRNKKRGATVLSARSESTIGTLPGDSG